MRTTLAGLGAALIFSVLGCASTTTQIISSTPRAQTTNQYQTSQYDIGTFAGQDIWVNPTAGNDANNGSDRSHAVRSIAQAWRLIPENQTLTTGYRIRLTAGTYPQSNSPNYWENRFGTAANPVIIEAADGPHTAVMSADINMYNVRYFYFIGVDIIRDGDAFHCELCDHIVIRDSEMSGGNGAHETIKVNQSQYIYIENSDIHEADDNAIDFVAVQYGHVLGNRIHGAQDWCAYAKGGSAYITFAHNEVFDCGTGGIAAGQGTGFEFMTAPWLNYEAYGMTITSNIIHDTEGAGLGVGGGYNILLNENILYRVGSRSHLVEFVRGRRGCDGDTAKCAEHRALGGWGSTQSEDAIIPNRHVYFLNNVIYNPAGFVSGWQHFQVDGPIATPISSGVPSPAVADDDLQIRGNLIWNGPPSEPLGIDQGCPATNSSCNEQQLIRDNLINVFEPRLVDPMNGDYTLTSATQQGRPDLVSSPVMQWGDTPLSIPTPTHHDDSPSPEPDQTSASAQLTPTTVIRLPVSGIEGLPLSSATAVSLNITVVQPQSGGFLTVWPCGSTRPNTSTINFVANQNIANGAIVAIDESSTVCIGASTTTQVLADFNGWFSSGFHAITPPERLVDTRPQSPQGLLRVDQVHVNREPLRINISNLPYTALPSAEVSALILNITAVNASSEGFVTAVACGNDEIVSSLNYSAGSTIANLAMVPIDPSSGDICLSSSIPVDILVDIFGWLDSSSFNSLKTTRVVDTRTQSPQGMQKVNKTLIGGENQLRIKTSNLLPLGVVSTQVQALIFNVTAIAPLNSGYITVFPCGETPNTSSLNYTAGDIIANFVATSGNGTGEICVYSYSLTDIVIDISGWFSIGQGLHSTQPQRLLDTRNDIGPAPV